MNKKLPRPLRVLIIDDDKSFVEELQRDANPHRIILDHAMSLEEAIEIMDERGEKAFAGIILDVICLKKKEQKVADESFLVKAKEVFDRKAPGLPKAILTAEPGHFRTLKPLYEGTLSVYLKGGEDHDRMFAFFCKEGEKLENVRMAAQYPEVFEVFEKQFLGNSEEQELIACLKLMDSSDPVVIVDNLGPAAEVAGSDLPGSIPKGSEIYSSRRRNRRRVIVQTCDPPLQGHALDRAWQDH